MKILGIETSCDETAAAVVQDGRKVLSNTIATSKDIFEKQGGVIPEIAARKQVECMISVIEKTLTAANVDTEDIDAIAVTKGPGLLGSLLVGTTTARVLAATWNKPLIGVHHTLGHLSSIWLQANTEPQFPLLALSVSGGHTELWYRTAYTEGKLLGTTLDDAAGEAFDKGAAMLGLSYPGGPAIEKFAEGGQIEAIEFPLPLKKEDNVNFSFSGLKTFLKNLLKDSTHAPLSDIAASYQHAICRHLMDRIERAVKQFPDVREIHIVGGVSANTHLRQLLQEYISGLAVKRTLRWPVTNAYCTDNAAMIASAGFYLLQEKPEEAVKEFETQASGVIF